MSTRFMPRVPLAVGLLSVAVIALASPSRLTAQSVRVGFGGGGIIPTGDYGSVDKLGWQIIGQVAITPESSRIGLRLDGNYGQTAHEFSIPGKSKVGGGMLNLLADLGPSESSIRPYLLAGVGVYQVRVEVTGFGSASETKAALDGGLGVAARLGPSGTRLFLEGRFVSVRTSGGATNFVPLTAGLTFAMR